ncbi:MAG: rod shape-determining protein MreC [Verrucomicrobia bacterium]|nr:MAG: rod shape-determining protein MreC [Verrucomicrobiota bacterium]
MRDRTLFVLILAGVVLLVILNLPEPVSGRLKGFVRDAVAPLQLLVVDISRQGQETIKLARGVSQLMSENQRQAGEIARLRLRLNELDKLEDETLKLRHLLEFRNRTPRRLIACDVLGRDASGWWQTLRLDKGANDSVHADMAVTTPEGLMGRVISATARTCDVLLISDPKCKISAMVSRSQAFGIVTGNGVTTQGQPVCRMEFINVDRRHPVQNGDEVVTSGLGGVFPKDLQIGRLENVKVNDSGLYAEAEVVIAADLGALDYVFVVAGLSPGAPSATAAGPAAEAGAP